MERQFDFVEKLGKDMSLKIFSCLEHPRDLAGVTFVSKSWRRFVIENELYKQLCLKLCPDVSKIIGVAELVDDPERVTISTLEIPGFLERDYRVFSRLSHELTRCPFQHLIKDAICASSTDRFPDESIRNTLIEEDFNFETDEPSYWSCKGKSDRSPTIPESLVYELRADLCLVSEIRVQPYQVYWERQRPICSAEAVRFCLGHRKSPLKPRRYSSTGELIYDDDAFTWTYTSPKFPMAQEAVLQRFHLPRLVLCFGGILKIELFGRVEKSSIDGLYYINVNHVRALGRRLGPMFNTDIVDDEGNCILGRVYGVSDD